MSSKNKKNIELIFFKLFSFPVVWHWLCVCVRALIRTCWWGYLTLRAKVRFVLFLSSYLMAKEKAIKVCMSEST